MTGPRTDARVNRALAASGDRRVHLVASSADSPDEALLAIEDTTRDYRVRRLARTGISPDAA